MIYIPLQMLYYITMEFRLLVMLGALFLIAACSQGRGTSDVEKKTITNKVEINLDDDIFERPKEAKPHEVTINLENYFPETNFDITLHRNHGTLIERFPPMMPKNATKSGRCSFTASVDESGTVTKIYELRCTDDVFLETTKLAALKWKFRPKTIQGKTIPFEAEAQKLVYKLLDEDGNVVPE